MAIKTAKTAVTTKTAKVKWQTTEVRKQWGKEIIYRARTTRSEIIVQGEILDLKPRLWIEVGMPKWCGLSGALDQAALEAKLADFRP